MQKCGFCKERKFRKKQKKISCQIRDTCFHKKCSQLSGKDFKLTSCNKFNSLCHSCFGKYVPFSHVNGSPKSNKNSKTCFPMNIMITPRSNKTNALNNKVNYFEIPHVNIASLNKHIDILSDVLSKMKFNFPIIGLSEHKIRSS